LAWLFDPFEDGDTGAAANGAPVSQFGEELQALIADMDETMRSQQGAGSRSADRSQSTRRDLRSAGESALPHVSPVPYTVLVNPELTPLGSEMDEGWEGCLSVPGMRGLVLATKKIALSGIRPAWRAD